ncbi:MAG: hypothetical protein MZV70_36510 [Desulfobacterales bacterium]|nr:hypothetical protein [Desulfobacterales bacterium]
MLRVVRDARDVALIRLPEGPAGRALPPAGRGYARRGHRRLRARQPDRGRAGLLGQPRHHQRAPDHRERHLPADGCEPQSRQQRRTAGEQGGARGGDRELQDHRRGRRGPRVRRPLVGGAGRALDRARREHRVAPGAARRGGWRPRSTSSSTPRTRRFYYIEQARPREDPGVGQAGARAPAGPSACSAPARSRGPPSPRRTLATVVRAQDLEHRGLGGGLRRHGDDRELVAMFKPRRRGPESPPALARRRASRCHPQADPAPRRWRTRPRPRLPLAHGDVLMWPKKTRTRATLALLLNLALPGCLLLLGRAPAGSWGEACEERPTGALRGCTVSSSTRETSSAPAAPHRVFSLRGLPRPAGHALRERRDEYAGVVGACWDNQCNAEPGLQRRLPLHRWPLPAGTAPTIARSATAVPSAAVLPGSPLPHAHRRPLRPALRPPSTRGRVAGARP